jgi:hypothetical protein
VRDLARVLIEGLRFGGFLVVKTGWVWWIQLRGERRERLPGALTSLRGDVLL